MKTTIILKSAVLAAGLLLASAPVPANEPSLCEKVFLKVRNAVEQEPQKVLVIVEDEMVANEPCACEIVRGAIAGSKADAALKRQIALTASHVAPHMARIIVDCVGPIPSEGGKGVVETVRAPDVQPETEGSGSDYSLLPGDIRGVYLIHPSTAGFGTFTAVSTSTHSSGSTSTPREEPRSRRSTSSRPIPQSPSEAQGP